VWLLATLTDVLNLPEACGPSVSCYYHALQMLLAQAVVGGPLSSLQHIMRALCSSSSVTHLVGVLGPSLLATYREVQARKAWAAQEEKNSTYEAESYIDQQPEPNQHPSAGQTSTAAVLGLSSKQQLQQLQLQDPQCPGTPAVVAPVQKPVSARGRAAAPPAAMKRYPAPAASVSPRIRQRLNNGRPWYVSPVVSKLVQFSLQQPPDASECCGRCVGQGGPGGGGGGGCCGPLLCGCSAPSASSCDDCLHLQPECCREPDEATLAANTLFCHNRHVYDVNCESCLGASLSHCHPGHRQYPAPLSPTSASKQPYSTQK